MLYDKQKLCNLFTTPRFVFCSINGSWLIYKRFFFLKTGHSIQVCKKNINFTYIIFYEFHFWFLYFLKTSNSNVDCTCVITWTFFCKAFVVPTEQQAPQIYVALNGKKILSITNAHEIVSSIIFLQRHRNQFSNKKHSEWHVYVTCSEKYREWMIFGWIKLKAHNLQDQVTH